MARDDGDEATPRPPRRAPGAAAELAMTAHELGSPADLRAGGEFTADEAELLRRHIRQYMARNNVDVAALVDLVQFSRPYGAAAAAPRKAKDANGATDDDTRQLATATQFWRETYDVLPRRKKAKKGGTTGIQRFVRRRYHRFKGSGGWTEDEDAMLVELVRDNPSQWTIISQTLGDRSDAACRDRWRNYLQYGRASTHKKARPWSEAEEAALVEAVAACVVTREDPDGNPLPLEQYTSRDINWQLVSERVGSRIRLHCMYKWKTLTTKPKDRPDKDTKPRKRQSKDKRPSPPDTKLPPPPPPAPSTPTTKPRKMDSATPTAATPTPAPRHPDHPHGFDDGANMRWGDKLDLILNLSENYSFPTVEEIDWDLVTKESKGAPWSARAREQALAAMLAAHREGHPEEEHANLDNGDSALSRAIQPILAFIESNLSGEMNMDEYYEDEVADAAKIGDEETEEDEEGVHPASKKRMLKAFPLFNLNEHKKFKSHEMVSMSDRSDEEL